MAMNTTPSGGSQPHDPPPAPKAAAAPTDDKAAAADKAARAAASIGAQVILAFDGDASLGARGGAGSTVEENTLARDAALVALGLDPVAPSGPPPSKEQMEARKKEDEAKAKASPADAPAPP